MRNRKSKSYARPVVSTQLINCLKSGFAVLMPDFYEPGGIVQGIAARVKLQQVT